MRPWLSSHKPADYPLGYKPYLDGVRAIAVIMVILFHSGLSFAGGGGVAGVNLFFVLSGFLITQLLLNEWNTKGRINLLGFYARRLIRLYPPLLFMGLSCLLWVFCFWETPEREHFQKGLGLSLLYISNWYSAFRVEGGGSLPLLEHTWSLGIEEQFYLIWPVMMIGASMSFGKYRFSYLPFSALAVGILAWRVHLLNSGHSSDRVFYGLDTRFDSLLMGCIAAWLLESKRDLIDKFHAPLTAAGTLAFAVILVFCVYPFGYRFIHSVGFTFFDMGAAIFLLSLVSAPQGVLARALSFPALTFLGRLSYGMYLWQSPVLELTQKHLPGLQNPAKTILLLGLSTLLAYVSFALVERSSLRLKKRFY